MTTAQAGFPTIPSEDEIHTTQDLQLGRPTARHLHPEISAFIGRKHDDILSQNRCPSVTELKLLELEREWGTGDVGTDTDEEIREMETQDHILWEPNPPKGEDDLGWVQIQQKSLMWEEKIGDFSVITHEGLTTLAHSSKMGSTITSGTWIHLRETWVPSPTTLLLRYKNHANLRNAWKN